MSRAQKSRGSRHIGRLTAAFVFFWAGVASATATAPVVRSPELVWRPVNAPDAPQRVVASPDAGMLVITDTEASRPSPTKPPIPAPTSSVIVLLRATEKPSSGRARSVSGRASWYCGLSAPVCATGFPMGGMYAAAGPRLRAAICGVQSCTSWRGRTVYVNGVPVRLIDWCQCYWHQSNEKLIDLYRAVFDLTGGNVTIRW